MDDQDLSLSFCEMLFTPALAYYFKSVHATNMNGFSSGSAPIPGVWEVFVYKSVDPRRKALPEGRVIKPQFIEAVRFLGKHLYNLERQGDTGQAVLEHIRTKDLTAEESALFGLFFDIVDNTIRTSSTPSKAVAVSIADYKRVPEEQLIKYRLNVKTFLHSLEGTGAYANNIKGKQTGGAPTERFALVATFVPLIKKSDDIPEGQYEQLLDTLKGVNVANIGSSTFLWHSRPFEPRTQIIPREEQGGEEATATQRAAKRQEEDQGQGRSVVQHTVHGGGRHLRGGATDDEVREAFIRILMEREFEAGQGSRAVQVDLVVTSEEIAQYIACVGDKTIAPVSNTLTLALLPTNTWRKLSDGSYEKLTPTGYKPLPREDCEKLICAGSNIDNPEKCEEFMKAVNNQNVDELVRMLTEPDAFVWDSNTAADTMDQLHPHTVLRILKAFGFGTKNGPYGKRVCTVDEWLSECVKNGSFKGSVDSNSLKPNMRSYLEHLVAFVNSNPSLVDPSKRHFAALSSATTPDELQKRGVYYAGDELSKSGSSQLSFHDVQKAVDMHQSGVNLASVLMYPTIAYGAVGGQRGGGPQLYTQAAQAQLSLGSGISQLVEQSLNGLQATSHGIGDANVAQIREKVKKLTTLEQEIYQAIIQLNELRLAADSGINCHSQLSSAQDRLMQLGSMYDRRAPCLQELCEQLRMLLAQQNKSGCEPIA